MYETPGDALDDEQFDAALNWRLGCKFAMEGLRCMHCKNDGELCDERLDVFCSHAFVCKCGGIIVHMHDAMADVLKDAVKAAGYRALREVVIPEWNARRPEESVRGRRTASHTSSHQLPYEEAILDVVGWGALHSERLIVDVTIRHPLAKKYLLMSSRTDGFANGQAHDAKRLRYPDKAGLRVTIASVESFGRLGKDFCALLDELAWSAKARQYARGEPVTHWAKLWRGKLAIILARGVAKSIKDALQGDGAKRERQS